jgi:hypothetical protein
MECVNVKSIFAENATSNFLTQRRGAAKTQRNTRMEWWSLIARKVQATQHHSLLLPLRVFAPSALDREPTPLRTKLSFHKLLETSERFVPGVGFLRVIFLDLEAAGNDFAGLGHIAE